MKILSIDNLNVSERRVFLRVDFNVPFEDGKILDDTRIRAALPTINDLKNMGGRIVLATHFGRPKGERNLAYSTSIIGERLSEILNQDIVFPEDCGHAIVKKLSLGLKDGEILLLENLRFWPGEEANQDDFAKKLAQYGDLYVNDAFGASHRAHASIVGVPKYLTHKGAGRLLMKEIEAFHSLLEAPKKPFIAILGGAKISDKLRVISSLLDKVDALIIGGGMAYTFLKAGGAKIGSSMVDDTFLDKARQILSKAKRHDVKMLLPVDHVISTSLDGSGKISETKGVDIPDGWMGVDIGPKSLTLFSKEIRMARTIVWNGPMGVFEKEPFHRGTFELAKIVATTSAFSIVGGGDSVAAINKTGFSGRISHISTGGGATLELLEGKILPGIKALQVD
ncbi:MAG: phosphoglycerate kinase, partial [Deltaproteobacteria bacterium RIFCSPHIGHO2_12_FULL_43_9]